MQISASQGQLQKKRVLIANDHTLLAEGLACILSAEFEVVGIASNGKQALTDAASLRPDIVVLDISLAEMNGIEAAQLLHKTYPEMRLVFVTQQVDPHHLRAAFRAGALGYVVKQSDSHELKTALRQAVLGRPFVTPFLSRSTAFTPSSDMVADRSAASRLTPRQRELLQLIAEGKTAREMSQKLNISIKTVEFHKKALMDSTGLRTTAELTRYAIANGVIAL